LRSCWTVRPSTFCRPITAAVFAGAFAAAVAGCSGGQPTPGQTVTVTATTEPTATPTTELPEGGDVEGRNHDVGTITGVEEAGGKQVLTLDRWTLVGVDDATLSRDGAPVEPYSGERFTNQNTDRTYTVPVAADAVLVVNECQPTAAGGGSPGLSSRRGELTEFLAQPDLEEKVVLLTYEDGELVQLDTDPHCPTG
jgi:hypothetical protein